MKRPNRPAARPGHPAAAAPAITPEQFRSVVYIDTDAGPRRYADVADDWQVADMRALDLSWQRVAGYDVAATYRRAYIERPRGHSKTADAALQAAYAIYASRRRLHGVVAAADADQARLSRDSIARLAALNGWLAAELDVQNYKVVNRRNGSMLEILSSDAATSYGITPDFIICDELSHWPETGELWTSLMSAAAKREHCLLVIISNAGLHSDCFQWSVREHARTSDWYFSRLDGPVASWISQELLAEQEAVLLPHEYARLWLNVWSDGHGDAIPLSYIEAACKLDGPQLQAKENWVYVAACDNALRSDHAAFVVLGVSFAPYRRIALAQLNAWVPTAGRDINQDDVERTVLAANKRFHFSRIVVDPHDMSQMSQHFRQSGIAVTEFWGTGRNADLAAVTIYESFRDGRVEIFRDRDLIRDLSKLNLVEGRTGLKLVPQKDKATGSHGDRGVAFAMALTAAVELAKHGCGGPASGLIVPYKVPRGMGGSTSRIFSEEAVNRRREMLRRGSDAGGGPPWIR